MIPLKDDNPTYSKPLVSYTIIGLCILVFLAQISSPTFQTGELFFSYGLIPSVLMGIDELPQDINVISPVTSIFTSMFMHGGWMHLIGNMLYMWIFADNIEDDIGKVKFIIFYLLCGIGAALSQVFVDINSQVPMVGASGAIGGVLGAYFINHRTANVLVLIPLGFFSQLIKIKALYVLGFWFVLQFINSAMSSGAGGGVAYAAHIGGFLTGLILILFFNQKTKKRVIFKSTKKTYKGPWEH